MIEYLLHVNTLFLTWQSNSDRKRYLVGELKKSKDADEFSYLVDTEDYKKAHDNGFLGYPAFPLGSKTYTNNVMATFMKRLPPRSRRDFTKYLKNNQLPETFKGNDFELITHTGIMLPSDGFDLIPDLSKATVPFDYVMEVAGTRHHLSFDEVGAIKIGTPVQFECEDENEHDSNAVALLIDGKKIGYINKLICPSFRKLMSKNISFQVLKTSGTLERPLIYVQFSVR